MSLDCKALLVDSSVTAPITNGIRIATTGDFSYLVSWSIKSLGIFIVCSVPFLSISTSLPITIFMLISLSNLTIEVPSTARILSPVLKPALIMAGFSIKRPSFKSSFAI